MKDKSTALITGATSGIGAAYARRLAADGYDLIVTGRRSEKLQALADELARAHHCQVDIHLVELSDLLPVEAFVESLRDRDIDLLVNNAGFGTTRYFHQEALEIQEKMVAAHILAHMKIVHAVLPRMIEKGAGAIVNVSSLGAYLPTPKTATYDGTKAFWLAFTESLRFELDGTGVQVQVVCPGLTHTDMHVRLGIPEEATRDRGFFRWITAEEVVACSLRCLKKKRVVCFPGRGSRMQVILHHLVPEALYFNVMGFFFRRYGWIEEEPGKKGGSRS